jgi:aromatic-L-amino-acid/L-tryptophan decarboxylase
VTDDPRPPDGRQLDVGGPEGLTDMDPEAFREAAHAVVDLMADYLGRVETYPVLPPIEPGSLRPLFPASPPERAEPLEAILADYRSLIEPNATHWQHPGFFAYFGSSGSAPGFLGEMLATALAQNPMLWRTSPIGTELEGVVVDWLRQALGLPPGFDGLLTDTASTSSLIALAAAREAGGLDAAARGLAGRDGLGAPRVYASSEAHSSIEKACMTLGIGRSGLHRVPVNDRYELRVEALEAAIVEDRAAGLRPIAAVATLGTTGSTSVDPIGPIADVTEREGLWLHVDAAYAGAAALDSGLRAPFRGWERADSIVVNPHKWFFTPFDASLLLTRRMDVLRQAFSVVPEYLRTLDRATPIRDYNEYQPQLGRRFRALKLWVQLRYFGLDGLRRRIGHQIELAQGLADRIDADPDWERLAPVPFSTVCLRWRPARLVGHEDEPALRELLDERNAEIMDAVNRTGEVFLSHTRLGGRFTIRLSISGIRTEARHVDRAWELLRREAARLDG